LTQMDRWLEVKAVCAAGRFDGSPRHFPFAKAVKKERAMHGDIS